MPLRAVCPECGATTTLDDNSTRRTVECEQCGKEITVQGAKASAPPPLPKSAGESADAGFEVLEDEEPAAATVPAFRPPADDEDEDNDRPAVGRRDDDDERPRARSSRDDDDDDDDDDDEDDRPRRTRLARDDDEDEDDRPKRTRLARDDDEEEDERPRARARRDDDDDDEDDQPKRTRLTRDEDEDDRPTRARSARDDEDEEDASDLKGVAAEDESESPSFSRKASRSDDDEDEDAPSSRATVGNYSDDDDEEDSRPSRARVSRGEDEDEEEEEPRVRRAAVGELDDEDDDGASIPRRRRGGGYPGSRGERSRAKSGKGGLIIMALLAFVVLGAGGGAAAYFFWPPSDVKVADNDQPKPPPDDDQNKNNNNNPVPPDKKQPDPPKDERVPKPNNLALSPVNLPDGKKTIPLPGKASDVCAGADGRFLFFHCADQAKLIVYDICQAGIVTELPTNGKESRIAAGLSKLFIANNATQKIERYDLAKLEKDKEGPYPFEGTIQNISLGHSSDGPAMVMGTAPANAWPIHFLDQQTLGLADIGYVGWTKPEASETARDLQFRAAAHGNAWVGLSPKSDAKDLYFVSRNGKSLHARKHECSGPPGYAALSADGRMVFSRFGKATVNQVEDREPDADPEKFVVPALNGEFHLWIEKFMGRERNAQVGTFQTANFLIETLSEIPQPYRPGAAMSQDRHAFYSPEARCLIIVPPEGERIEVRQLDPLKSGSNENIFVMSNQSLTFTPGKPVNHKFRVLTNSKDVKFTLVESETAKSMKGLSVSPNGEIKWDAPADEARDVISFQVEVSGKMRKDLYFVTLHNSKAAVPSKIDPKPKDKTDPKTPTVGMPPNVAPGAKLVQEPPGRLPITVPEMKDAQFDVALPGPIRDACVGGGGRYIIFHCPTVRKLAIFDVTTLKVEKQITLATDEILFAAGMEKLLVIYPDEKQVHRYSLASYKLEDDIALEARQRPTAAAIGSATSGPLVLGGIPAQNNASKMVLSFLDLVTLKEVWIEKAEGDFKVSFGAAAHLRASADGRTLGSWLMQLRPSGLQVARLADNTISGSYLAESVGHVTPGPDGQTIFTEKGMYTMKGEPTGKREAAVPAVHGNWYLTLAPNAKGPADAKLVQIWEMGKDTAIQEFNDVPGFNGKRDPFERDTPTLALDRKFFLIPEAKVMVVLPPAANKLHVYRIGAMKK